MESLTNKEVLKHLHAASSENKRNIKNEFSAMFQIAHECIRSGNLESSARCLERIEFALTSLFDLIGTEDHIRHEMQLSLVEPRQLVTPN